MSSSSFASRWGRLLGWAVLMVVIALVPLAFGWSHLPDPAATHWGVGGAPDDSMRLIHIPLVTLGAVGVGLLTTSLFRKDGRPTAEAVAMVGLMGGLMLALNISLVSSNWGASSWEEADPFGWWSLVLVLGAAAVFGYLSYRVGLVWYPRSGGEWVAESTSVKAGTWRGSTVVRWPLFVLGVAAFLLLGAPGNFWVLSIVFVVLAVLFVRVDVIVDDQGLSTRLAGIPVKRYRFDQIDGARSIDLEPAAWGGWGWRAVPSGHAIVLRRGEAIELRLRNDRRFAVTVDDSATGAAVINGLIGRHAGRRSTDSP